MPNGGCDWCLVLPKSLLDDKPVDEVDWEEEKHCDKTPAHFKVLNGDGEAYYYCAEHYDAFMAGKQDEWMRFDAEGGFSWFKPDGKPYEEEDFEPLEDEE